MKKMFPLIIIVLFSVLGHSQIVNKIIHESIEEGIADANRLLENKITENIKVVGLGDVACITKETTKFNMAVAAYLISRKNFTSVALMVDNIDLIATNKILEDSNVPFDRIQLDSAYNKSFGLTLFSASQELKDFIYWLKQYNLVHHTKCRLVGLGFDELFSPAYFLTNYIYTMDKRKAVELSLKWADKKYNLSLSYEDIKQWREQIRGNKKNENISDSLLSEFDYDMKHNQTVNFLRSEINIPSSWQVEMTFSTSEFLRKTKEKTILYALNNVVSKSNFLSEGKLITSVGKFLTDSLHNSYYVLMTDFSDSSTLYRMKRNVEKNKWERGSLDCPDNELLRRYKNKDVFYYPEDKLQLYQFKPRAIQALPTVLTYFPDSYETSYYPFDILVNLGKLNSSVPLKQVTQ